MAKELSPREHLNRAGEGAEGEECSGPVKGGFWHEKASNEGGQEVFTRKGGGNFIFGRRGMGGGGGGREFHRFRGRKIKTLKMESYRFKEAPSFQGEGRLYQRKEFAWG